VNKTVLTGGKIMRNFNLAVLEGRLTSNPELKYTQGGTAMCRFSIANNHAYYKENELKEEVNYIDVTTWSKLADQCNEYLKKGRRVIVNGRIKQSKWEDDEGGKHSKISIVAYQVQFLDYQDDDVKDGAALPEDEEAF
jgi:single-strand DNA-binding protein